jgi:phosphoribosyl-ATP pyrophosphohydrolase
MVTTTASLKNEAADLLITCIVLLRAKSVNLTEIEEVLLSRHKPG